MEINIYYNNVQSLMDKLDEMKFKAVEETPELICCVETWLDKSHTLSEIEIKNYNCINKIRSQKPNRGGVCIYYKHGIVMEEIKMKEHSKPCNCEAIWTKLTDGKGKKIIIALIYRSPSNTNFIEHIEEDLNHASQLNLPIVLLGDINIDLLRDTPNRRALSEVFGRQCMDQMITSPTRITDNTQTLIDHIWTTDKDIIKNLVIKPGLSDHHMCQFKIEGEYTLAKKSRYTFRNINKNAGKIVKELEEADWEELMSTENSEDAWRNLKTTIINAMDKHAPEKISTQTGTDQPWMSAELKTSIRRKGAVNLRRAYGMAGKEEWRVVKGNVKRLTWNLKKQLYSRRVEENQKNPNKLWKIIKDIAPSNFSQKKEAIEMDINMLNEFNSHFVKTGYRIQQQLEDEINEHHNEQKEQASKSKPKNPTNQLTEVKEATVEQTIKIINNIDVNKATGIDKIPMRIIKSAVHTLAKPITSLVNTIFTTGQIPLELKTAVVTPTFKSGDKTKVENYRPLSILPAISKVMEYFMKDQLCEFLERNNLIADTQHAFRKGHSTTTCLLKLTEDIRLGMDEGKATGILAIDLSKAFDAINHTILIRKLHNMGINGKFLELIKDYLRDRTQCVKYMDIMSKKEPITHGVPQGSILGPIFFMIFMNDLNEVVENCKILSYADDTTLYFTSKNASNIQVAINQDINKLEKWFLENRMKLNESKTELMVVQPKNKDNSCSKIHIAMKNRIIPHSEKLKILGITINNKLKWDTHINDVIRACKYQLRAFRRSMRFLNLDERKMLYNSCIASRLAYGDIIWKETTEQLKYRLQVIQNQAARAILSKKPRASADPLLKQLNWIKLEDKRKMHGEVLFHKIENGTAPRSLQEMMIRYRNENAHNSRRNQYFIPSYKTNIMGTSYYITTIKSWNKIPTDLKATKETKNFKARLNNYYTRQYRCHDK